MSVDYLQWVQSGDAEVMKAYFEFSSACEQVAGRDNGAAVLIQRHWRGYRDRSYIKLLHAHAVRIQRVYRGHRGRLRAREALRERNHVAMRSFYDSMATTIQKVVRGWISRVHQQDVYARRGYINSVAKAGTAVSRASEKMLSKQLVAKSDQETQSRSKRFEAMTSNMHHLISTKAIPSVFKSPLTGTEATAFNVPVEEHIREAFSNRQTTLQRLRPQVFKATSSTSKQKKQQQTRGSAPPASFISSTQQQTVQAFSSTPQQQQSSNAEPSTFVPMRSTSAGVQRSSSRPASAGRLAPLHAAPSISVTESSPSPSHSSLSASPTHFATTQVRASTPSSQYQSQPQYHHSQVSSQQSSTSSLHPTSFHASPSPTSAAGIGPAEARMRNAMQQLQQTETGSALSTHSSVASLHQQSSSSSSRQSTLPSIRSSTAAGTPSGRTLNASDLYNSKINRKGYGRSGPGVLSADLGFGLEEDDDEEEEKQSIPLALASGGHVSTTPTSSPNMFRHSGSLAATRMMQPTKPTRARAVM